MSAFNYTEEQLNYFRVGYLATRVIPDGLRTVFKTEWNNHFKASHGQWQDTAQNGKDFFHLESPRNQKRNAKNLTTMKKGNTNEWDCTRLFYAICYSDSVGARLNPLVKKQIDELREFRNGVFAHRVDGELTNADFLAEICKVEAAFSHLSLNVSVIKEMKNQKGFPTEELSKLKEDLEKEKRRPFCTLPPKPSHKTVQRQKEVKQVMEHLQRLKSATSDEVTVVYLSGNPGCGKSQVARQVGDTFFSDGTDNKFVFTFNASTTDTLLQSYLELAGLLRCDEDRISWIETTKELSKEQKLVKVKQLVAPRIEKYSSWLMILDNVTKLKSVICYVPQAGDKTQAKGQIIITTQDSHYIPVDSHSSHSSLSFGMQEEGAVAALTEISGLSGEEESKREVAKELDFQPLALACAAVYMQQIKQSKPSWKKYLQLLKEGKRKSTERVFTESNQSYSLSMSYAVELAVTNAIETSKVMEHTFEFLSVIASEPIALTHVLEYVKNCLSDEGDDLICSIILSSSLILCCEDEAIRLHQIVHSHLLTQFQKRNTETKNEVLIHSINSFSKLSFDFDERKAMAIIETRTIAKHLHAFVKNLQDNFDFDSAGSSDLIAQNLETITTCLEKMALISYEHGKYLTSKLYYELELSLREKVCHENHPTLATTLSNLGLILQKLGQYEEAKRYTERAVAIQENVYDENHPTLATFLSNLGLILRDLGQHEEAKRYMERALAIKENVCDKNHPTLATTLSNLGLILGDLGQYEEAKRYMERAVAIQENVYDENHPTLATFLSNLGMILGDLGQYEEAKRYMERALAIEENVYDENHPTLATFLSNLGLILRDLEQYEEAKRYMERALAIQENVCDENHPTLATLLSNLGMILRDLGQYEEAKRYMERALAIQENVYDENHPTLATFLSNLGLILRDLGQYEEAKRYMERALAIQENVYDENHPALATTLSNLGVILRDLGQCDEAKKHRKRAFAKTLSTSDESHRN